MASPARILANQSNARLSTGPRSQEGRAKVSSNATTHGLTSKRLVLASEDQTAFLDKAVAEIQEENPELTPDEALAQFFLDKAQMKKMSLFLRYQSAIERAYHKAMAELTAAQKLRCRQQQEEAALQAWADTARQSAVGFVSQPGPELPSRPPAVMLHTHAGGPSAAALNNAL